MILHEITELHNNYVVLYSLNSLYPPYTFQTYKLIFDCIILLLLDVFFQQIRDDRFFDEGFTPSSLPNSSLTMAPRFSSAHHQPSSSGTERRPLAEANRDLRANILSSIPESKPTSDKNNVSRAVFVRDGLGHDVDEDPEKEDDGMLFTKYQRCFKGKSLLKLTSTVWWQYYLFLQENQTISTWPPYSSFSIEC